ncbi:hypothetical protein BST81_23030 [Leptolyngbya sp. 'hensonii']|uniref:cation transporter n=1 Tax=Leptolyngbya sp. 'hensonii' TaxID=1922337 RepID=UPI00094F9700|nr:hypothetical protein BST81_23030 [Leptolyngbya sp. 'hensonii']
MVADAASSIGVILAAIAIWILHWLWVDGVMSLFVASLIVVGSVPLVLQSLNILLEKPSGHLDLARL